MIYIFDRYEVDSRLYELRRNGESTKIEPKVFDLLTYLIKHRSRVVTKAELMEKLWPGEHITEAALIRCVVAARKAVQDNGAQQRIIKTLRGRGYRFTAPIQECDTTEVTVARFDVDHGQEPEPIFAAKPSSHYILVGRQREIKTLQRNLEHTLMGQGHLTLLAGEPGIGKTRIVQELAAYAHKRDVTMLSGHCYGGAGAPFFWPWVQIIRGYTRDRDPAEIMSVMAGRAADIAAVVPEVRQILPGLPTPEQVNSDQVRFRFFDGITTLLKNITRDQPLVLCLDDLHWADKPSLLLLQFLAREISGIRLLVIGTYSDVALGRHHPLAQTLAELAREDLGQRIHIRGLSQRDVSRFIEGTTGFQPCEALVSEVYRKTEGNPFFIKEIVRLLASDGRLQQQDSVTSWDLTIPREIREVIGRRLSHLSDACNSVLSIASVIGRAFDLDVLERLCNLSADRLLEVLEEAIACNIIDEAPYTVGRYRFSHALIHETLYEDLTTTRRIRIHRRIGDTLERLYAAEPDPHLDQLAYHFFEGAPAGRAEKAVMYASRAAESAAIRLAFEEAVAHYEKALQALDRCRPVEQARRAKLMVSLGEAQVKAGNVDQAQKTFQRAKSLRKNLAANKNRTSTTRRSKSGMQKSRGANHRRSHSKAGMSLPPDSRSDQLLNPSSNRGVERQNKPLAHAARRKSSKGSMRRKPTNAKA